MKKENRWFFRLVLVLVLIAVAGIVAIVLTKPQFVEMVTSQAVQQEAATAKEEGKDDDADKDEGEVEDEAASKDKDEGEDEAADKVDVSNVDFDVAEMSDEDAFNFMHDFLNRTPDEHAADFGKVMHIKGQVGKYTKVQDDGDLVSYSVGVKGEGGTIWAINFYVAGWSPEDYPENKALVEVTGVYGEVENYGTNAGKTLICNAEDVILVEE